MSSLRLEMLIYQINFFKSAELLNLEAWQYCVGMNPTHDQNPTDLQGGHGRVSMHAGHQGRYQPPQLSCGCLPLTYPLLLQPGYPPTHASSLLPG